MTNKLLYYWRFDEGYRNAISYDTVLVLRGLSATGETQDGRRFRVQKYMSKELLDDPTTNLREIAQRAINEIQPSEEDFIDTCS